MYPLLPLVMELQEEKPKASLQMSLRKTALIVNM